MNLMIIENLLNLFVKCKLILKNIMKMLLDCKKRMQSLCVIEEYVIILLIVLKKIKNQLWKRLDGLKIISVMKVTAAIGAEKYYTLENNEARYESKEQARTLDGLTARSWIGHQNVQVIDNVGNDFNRKMERVLSSISSLVNEPQTQYQRKYLLKQSLNRDEIPSDYNVSQFTDIVTFLVSNNENIQKRIIKRKFKHHYFPSYFLVQRVLSDKHSETRETQRILNERQYFDFLSQSDQERIKLVKETMRFLLVKDNSYQICTVEHVKREGKDSIEILRVTRDSEKKNDLVPEFLSVDKDISENEEYFSRNMSKK